MLEALPAATAFGQKAQEDSRLGQSSIFDLGGGAEEAGPSRQHHAPIRAEEFDQRELLRLAGGKPTFQWIEEREMKCPQNPVTPATIQPRRGSRLPAARPASPSSRAIGAPA